MEAVERGVWSDWLRDVEYARNGTWMEDCCEAVEATVHREVTGDNNCFLNTPEYYELNSCMIVPVLTAADRSI